MGSIQSVCVYCSSSSDVEPVYLEAARELGELIATEAGTLVFGGNCLGLMNETAAAVHRTGGRVVGVTPRKMHENGTSYKADELIVTETMAERKSTMIARADAFVAMPGGFGTLEELFEVLVLRILGYHDKPIVIVNIAGFYDPLVSLFEHMYAHRFARDKVRRTYRVVRTVGDVMGAFSEKM